jgi:hypothetical protein
MALSIRRHSPTAVAAYHDLVSLLLDNAASDMRGAPTLRERNGRRYWYDRYRIGQDTKERYLGEDSPDLRQRIEQFEDLKDARKDRSREQARLVRMLRGERFRGLDGATGSLISALARTGTFRLGGLVVGTIAFRLYEGELGLRLTMDEAAATNDIDIASFERLSLAVRDTVETDLHDVFKDFDFSPIPSLDRGRTWRWRQSKTETMVEFLTPSFDEEEEGVRELAALGVSAQSLHHLNFLISDPIDVAAVYREGVLVKLPRPERFAIHKLIVADRRREGPDSLKARKDLKQAEILISVLAEDRPVDLAEAYEAAVQSGPKWRQRIESSLRRAPTVAETLALVL